MKKTVLVDIGIIVEYLKTGKGSLPSAYETHNLRITASTYAEILASQTFMDSALESEVVEFLQKYFDLLPIDQTVASATAKVIRNKGENMTFATALVAGTAIANSIEILTDRPGDFDGIEGVTCMSM
jgi:predicted nucleic acid-binding protein